MPPAARVHDPTPHPGVVRGPGARTVLVNGRAAAAAGDIHICSMPPNAGPHPPTPFAKGSATVLAGGRPMLRVGDVSGCGAPISAGSRNVFVGG